MFPVKLVVQKEGQTLGVVDLQRVQAIQLGENMATAVRDLKTTVIVLGFEPGGILSFKEGRLKEKPVIEGLAN
jgi:hypothetical protein